MKLYHFHPQDWGNTYYIMAESKADAVASLLIYLKKSLEKNKKKGYDCEEEELEIKAWEKANPNNKKTYPNKFTIEVYEKGEVIHAEFS